MTGARGLANGPIQQERWFMPINVQVVERFETRQLAH